MVMSEWHPPRKKEGDSVTSGGKVFLWGDGG